MGMTAFLTFTTLVLPPVGYLVGAVIALVTLIHGGRDGLITLVGGLALAVVVNQFTGGSAITLVVLALFWLPVWLLALVLKSVGSLRIVFQMAALFGVVLLFLFYMLIEGNPSIWWQGVTQELFMASAELGEEVLLDERLAKVLTGILAAGFFLGLVVMLLIGRGWQAMLYNPGGLKEEFLALQLGKNSVLLGLVVMLPSMLMGDGVPSMVPDLMQIWMTLFMLQGLAVAHAVVHIKLSPKDGSTKAGTTKGWVITLYMLTLLTPLGFIVTMVGVTDAWVDYRSRFNKMA
jgi:hypothetical protein